MGTEQIASGLKCVNQHSFLEQAKMQRSQCYYHKVEAVMRGGWGWRWEEQLKTAESPPHPIPAKEKSTALRRPDSMFSLEHIFLHL